MTGARGWAMVTGPAVDRPGGAPREVRVLAAGLVERGYRVVSITSDYRRWLPKMRRGMGSLDVILPGAGRLGIATKVYVAVGIPLAAILGLLLRVRGVFAIGLQTPALVASTVAIMLSRPLVMRATLGVDQLRRAIESRPRRLRRWLLSHGVLLAQTPPTVEAMRALGVNHRILLHPPMIQHPPHSRPLNGRPGVAYAARFVSQKHPLLLLDAWESVVAAMPSARLTMCGGWQGPGTLEPEVRRRVAATPALRETVSLPGWVDDAAERISDHDVFVLPSREEGLSVALLEACGSGRVIVASDIPQNASVFEPGYPLLHRCGDARDLAAKLLIALTDRTMRARARTAAIAVAGRQRSERSLDAIVGLIEESPDGRSRVPGKKKGAPDQGLPSL